ncbi:MAG: FAD-binding oxidoreductase [Chloroflexi bacterium]|nr:FAD-binding oxidoreductase [Chloroflexota bacterium]
MSISAEVVVVGAGSIGCATAYALARQGAKVIVLDREAPGAGASFHATGLLPPWQASTDPALNALYDASLRLSRELFPRLQEETGIPLLYQVGEGLRVALRDDQVPLGRELAAAPGLAGAGLAYLDAGEARRLEPRLSPDILGGLWCDGFLQVDSYRYTLALAQAAEGLGVQFQTAYVTGLERQGRRLRGLQTPTGVIPCDRAVLALGAWSAGAGAWLGMPVPVRPVKGQNMRLRWEGAPLPYLMGQIGWGHLIQRGDGYLSAGSTEEEGMGLDASTTAEARDRLMKHALAVMPCLETAQVVQQFAGPRPVSQDGLPIMGPATTLEGVFLNTGHGYSGIFLAAASGRHVADLVMEGRSSIAAPDPFLPARFLPDT